MAEPLEVLPADRLRPLRLDSGVGCNGRLVQPLALLSEADQSRPIVGWVGTKLEVPVRFQVPQQVVDGLLAELSPGGQFGRAPSLGTRPPEQGHVGRTDIGEAGRDYAGVDAPAHVVQRQAQQRAELEWRD